MGALTSNDQDVDALTDDDSLPLYDDRCSEENQELTTELRNNGCLNVILSKTASFSFTLERPVSYNGESVGANEGGAVTSTMGGTQGSRNVPYGIAQPFLPHNFLSRSLL